MSNNPNEMTKKTKYVMYSGSFLYGLSMIIGLPNLWRVVFLVILTTLFVFIVDEPAKSLLRKIIKIFLFLLFVGSLIGLALMIVKLLIMIFIQ